MAVANGQVGPDTIRSYGNHFCSLHCLHAIPSHSCAWEQQDTIPSNYTRVLGLCGSVGLVL